MAKNRYTMLYYRKNEPVEAENVGKKKIVEVLSQSLLL